MQYRFDRNPGGGQQVLLALVKPNSEVLDVGCASGYLGLKLASRGCKVWGIERDLEAIAHIPKGTYVDVLHADLQGLKELPWIDAKFDVIVAADVLEHLTDPIQTLRLLKQRLKSDGRLLVSLPNIAHLSMRISLLAGRFRYKTTGIMDRTHVHLYTFATAIELLKDAGFIPVRTLSGSDRFGKALNGVPGLGRFMRGLLAYNIVLEAVQTD